MTARILTTAMLSTLLFLFIGLTSASADDSPPKFDCSGQECEVDQSIYDGWKVIRQVCIQCHGKYGEGANGPSLLERVPQITREEFDHSIANGVTRGNVPMPPWGSVSYVMDNLDNIYAYVMARVNGLEAKNLAKPKK